MQIRQMQEDDIKNVIPIYLEYYNNVEGGCWTFDTANRRISQVCKMNDSYCLIMHDGGEVIGFAMGYFKQYDDLLGYALEEILIAKKFQNNRFGTQLLDTLENNIKQHGVTLVELIAVNDELHEHFYGKVGYKTATSLVPKTKWL